MTTSACFVAFSAIPIRLLKISIFYYYTSKISDIRTPEDFKSDVRDFYFVVDPSKTGQDQFSTGY